MIGKGVGNVTFKKLLAWLVGFIIIGIVFLAFLWLRVDHVPLTRSELEQAAQIEKAFHDIRSQDLLRLKSMKDLKDLVGEFGK